MEMASLGSSKRHIYLEAIAVRLQGLPAEERERVMWLMARAFTTSQVFAELGLTRMLRALARGQECLNAAAAALRKLDFHE